MSDIIIILVGNSYPDVATPSVTRGVEPGLVVVAICYLELLVTLVRLFFSLNTLVYSDNLCLRYNYVYCEMVLEFSYDHV